MLALPGDVTGHSAQPERQSAREIKHSPNPADNLEAQKVVFAANCAVCHGPDAKGKTDVGSPNLTDRNWMYGGDEGSLYMTVWGGLQGHMPTWESRLSPVDRKILALYLVDLRKPRP